MSTLRIVRTLLFLLPILFTAVHPDVSAATRDYVVTVKTGNDGTDASIRISLWGPSGDVQGVLLSNANLSSKKPSALMGGLFEKGSEHTFRITGAQDVGTVERVALQSDNGGVGPSWRVENVVVDGVRFSFNATISKPRLTWYATRTHSSPTPLSYPGMPEAPTQQVPYVLKLVTGSRSQAGTDATIYIRLHGSLGSSTWHALRGLDTERGRAVSSTIVAKDVGDVRRVAVRHDGTGPGPDWFLEYLTVRRPTSPDTVLCDANRWIMTGAVPLQLEAIPSYDEIVPRMLRDRYVNLKSQLEGRSAMAVFARIARTTSEQAVFQRFLAAELVSHPRLSFFDWWTKRTASADVNMGNEALRTKLRTWGQGLDAGTADRQAWDRIAPRMEALLDQRGLALDFINACEQQVRDARAEAGTVVDQASKFLEIQAEFVPPANEPKMPGPSLSEEVFRLALGAAEFSDAVSGPMGKVRWFLDTVETVRQHTTPEPGSITVEGSEVPSSPENELRFATARILAELQGRFDANLEALDALRGLIVRSRDLLQYYAHLEVDTGSRADSLEAALTSVTERTKRQVEQLVWGRLLRARGCLFGELYMPTSPEWLVAKSLLQPHLDAIQEGAELVRLMPNGLQTAIGGLDSGQSMQGAGLPASAVAISRVRLPQPLSTGGETRRYLLKIRGSDWQVETPRAPHCYYVWSVALRNSDPTIPPVKVPHEIMARLETIFRSEKDKVDGRKVLWQRLGRLPYRYAESLFEWSREATGTKLIDRIAPTLGFWNLMKEGKLDKERLSPHIMNVPIGFYWSRASYESTWNPGTEGAEQRQQYWHQASGLPDRQIPFVARETAGWSGSGRNPDHKGAGYSRGWVFFPWVSSVASSKVVFVEDGST